MPQEGAGLEGVASRKEGLVGAIAKERLVGSELAVDHRGVAADDACLCCCH